MLNQVVLVGEVEMVDGKSILVNVDDEKIAVTVWDNLAEMAQGFVGKTVAVKGKIHDGGVIAERVSVLTIDEGGKEE